MSDISEAVMESLVERLCGEELLTSEILSTKSSHCKIVSMKKVMTKLVP